VLGDAQEVRPVEQVIVVDSAVEQTQYWLLVTVNPVKLTPSLRAAVWIPAVFEAVTWL
jgi:hypothetical protein